MWRHSESPRYLTGKIDNWLAPTRERGTREPVLTRRIASLTAGSSSESGIISHGADVIACIAGNTLLKIRRRTTIWLTPNRSAACSRVSVVPVRLGSYAGNL